MSNIKLKAPLSKFWQLGLAGVRNARSVQDPWIGNIDRIRDGIIEGWVKSADDGDPLKIEILLNDVLIASDLSADLYRRDVEDAGIGSGCYGFAHRISADKIQAGGRITIQLSTSHEAILAKTIEAKMIHSTTSVVEAPVANTHKVPAGPQLELVEPEVPPAAAAPVAPAVPAAVAPIFCEGRIEVLTDGLIRGWASDRYRRGRIFDIEILVDGLFLTRVRNDLRRSDLLRHGKSEGLGGFQQELFLGDLEAGEHTVTAVLKDGQKLTATIKTHGNRKRYVLNSGIAGISPADVMVIVPIYNAADDVEVCIQRLASYLPPDLGVLLIDDASPDPRIATIMAEAESLPGFRVLRNSENLGFTRTINRGFEEIGNKHAILLNSDARVTPGWSQGMLRAATSRPRVATVTAMSDRAGAFSAPRIGSDNKLPDGVDEITYARAFRRRALGLYPVVPTGNGFCMFVNRECIDEIGPLDADAFPRGYGEEDDFCMRAGRVGWNHLIDDRTYVFHDRSKSFGEAKADLMTVGRRVVDERYPEYKTAIRTFTTGAELAMARLRAAQAVGDCSLQEAGRPAILFVVATQTGGTPQTNMDLMQEIADEMTPYLLHCNAREITLSKLDSRKLVNVRSHSLSEPVDPLTHRSGEYDAVVRDWLDNLEPSIVHIRHLAWHSMSLPALAKACGSKVVFSFHDFYALCPTVKLLDENNIFCGGTCTKTEGECAIDLWDAERLPRIKDSWVHVWRKRFSDVLKHCDAYVTTSQSARARILAHLDLDADRFFVIPHGRNFSRMEQLRHHPRHGEPVRILIPGNIDTAKGRDIILALLEQDRAGQLEFHILGNISDPAELKQHKRLVLHGSYQREGFATRVAHIKPHLGAVLSIWDETYCHTLTELWSAGVPAIVFDFPTVAGRVRACGGGWVVPHEDIAALYEKLVALSFNPEEQIRADIAIQRWQSGNGIGRTTKVMASAYRDVYRRARGQDDSRPLIAVVCPAAPELDIANASTEIRIWERTANGMARRCNFVRMTPHTLLANLRDGIIDGAVLQRNVIPATLGTPLLEEMDRNGVRYTLDLDDNLFAVPEDKDPTGAYAAYVPALETLVASAAFVTTSTETLRREILPRNNRTVRLPNRLSERLWRGELPARNKDGMVRALYMGTDTHRQDFDLIAPVLEHVAAADPAFRVAIIGIMDGDLPAWAERIVIPNGEKSYSRFVPWLRNQSARFDIGLAPLTDAPFNLFKSPLKAMDYGALGLPVLASDTPVFAGLDGRRAGLRLVGPQPDAWHRALINLIADVRAGAIDRAAIRAATLDDHGLASTLPALDEMLVSISRPADDERRSAGRPPIADVVEPMVAAG